MWPPWKKQQLFLFYDWLLCSQSCCTLSSFTVYLTRPQLLSGVESTWVGRVYWGVNFEWFRVAVAQGGRLEHTRRSVVVCECLGKWSWLLVTRRHQAVCMNAGLWCTTLWMVNKIRRAPHKYSPFTKQQQTTATHWNDALNSDCKQVLSQLYKLQKGKETSVISINIGAVKSQLLTSVDVNVLPQCLILLQVFQEVLVLSEDRKASYRKLHMVTGKNIHSILGTYSDYSLAYLDNAMPLVTISGIFPYFCARNICALPLQPGNAVVV